MTVLDQPRARSAALRVRALLFHPKSEWEVIASEPATVRGIYTGYVMILAAIPAIARLIGGLLFGSSLRLFGGINHTSITGLVVSAIIGYLLSLVGVYVVALIIDGVAPYVGGMKDRTQAMKVAAFFQTASWLAGVFALVPALAPLQVLGLYSLFLLYLGLARLMRVGEDKALIYTVAVIISAVIVMLVISLATHMLSGTGMSY